MGPVTLRQALLELVDITTPPRKSLLHALVQYAGSEADGAALKALAAGTDQPAHEPRDLHYAQWIKEDRRFAFLPFHHLISNIYYLLSTI